MSEPKRSAEERRRRMSPLLVLAIGAAAVAAFLAVLAGYAVKLATAFDAIRAEFRHPVAGNLFGTAP